MIDYPDMLPSDDERQTGASDRAASAVKAGLATLIAVLATLYALEIYVSTYYWGISPSWYQVIEDGDLITFRCQDYAPVQFDRLPAPGVTRILVLGGSNPFGYPERPEGPDPLPQRYGFVGALQAAAGDAVEFVNLSVNGGSSEDALRMLRRAAGWGASGAVIYTGHSELIQAPESFEPLLWPSALYRSYKSLGGRRTPRAERWVQAPWVASASRREALVAQLERNLLALADEAEDQGLPVVAVLPALNLAGLDPSWSTAGEDFDMRALWGYSDQALEGLFQNRQDVAELNWVLGQRRIQAGLDPTRPLWAAVDADGLPLRSTSRVRATIGGVAERSGWLLVDAMGALPGVPGDESFYDNAHLRPEAAGAVAGAVAEALAQLALLPGVPAPSSPALSADEAAEAAVRTAKYWIRWACIRSYDPGLRLERAGYWVDRALSLRPRDREAHALRAVLARLSGDPSPPDLPRDEDLRRDLERIHPLVAAVLDSG